ncbi:MAG: ABC transporter ATP-binding protein [Betaproteobacteria bacterium]
MALLEVADLAVDYSSARGTVQAVRDVTFELERDEVLGIVGESGSGKSTLAHAILGYRLKGTSRLQGRVTFDGVSLLDCPPAVLRRTWGRRMAIVHQNPLASLTPTMRVGEQIAETLRQHRGATHVDSRSAVAACLRSVGLPEGSDIARRYPHQLSGGQRQRITIAIALSLEPDLMILDEPTTNLDATTEAVILDLLGEIKARTHTAMVYISHNLGVIARVATRVAVMYAGEFVEYGRVDDIFRSPAHPYTRALLACRPRAGQTKRDASLQWIGGEIRVRQERAVECIFRDRCPAKTDPCAVAPGWSDMASGHSVRCWNASVSAQIAPASGPATDLQPTDDIVLDASQIRKTFGRRSNSVRAVNDVSMRVRRGAIVGLVGESGSGKSTLLRCIAGLEVADGGKTAYLGADIPASLAARDREILKTMQMVFQDPESTLNPSLTIGTTLRRHLKSFRPVDSSEADRRIERALEQVRLGPQYQHRLPRELSGGEKQRIAIARAFLSAPELVLCDEPLSSLDVSVQSAICQLLLDLQRDSHASYVFVSHDLSIVRYMADRITVMYLGEVIEEGSAQSFDQPPVHPYTEALFSATQLPDPAAKSQRVRLVGQISEADKYGLGCIFNSRCHRRKGPECADAFPPWQELPERRYRCHWSAPELRGLQEGGIGATPVAPYADR